MTKKKALMIVLIGAGILFVITCGVFYSILTANNMEQQKHIGTYLERYEEEAAAYLREDEAFVTAYGSDCALDVRSWSYSYTDPKKYPAFSLRPKYPATAELFEQELDHMQVGFILPDGRACTVSFGKTPEGGQEIIGWEYADE